MTIIGITGAIGHGKSTLAEAFGQAEPRAQHLESFQIIAEVVDKWHTRTSFVPNPHDLDQLNNWLFLLPEILEEVVHEPVDRLALHVDLAQVSAQPALYEKLFQHLDNLKKNPALLQNHITETNKADYRPILQWLGGYLVLEVDPGIWYKEILRRTEFAKIEGVELCTIGGLRYPTDAELIRAADGIIAAIHRPMMGEQDSGDLTERQRSQIHPDVTVLNNADVPALNALAKRMYNDIKLGKLQTHYAATGL